MKNQPLCRFTGVPVPNGEGRLVGGMIAGINVKYVAHRDSKQAERECRRAFDESEANCNTCGLLIRDATLRRPHSLLAGHCEVNPRPFKFHPDDPMHMPCYMPRWAAGPEEGGVSS